jgi:hypothetical protein
VRASLDERPRSKHRRIFIASIHWNNERIIRSHWNKALIDLIRYLGKENVFVSILESGSWDNTKGALQELDAQLGEMGVQRKIMLDHVTHTDLINQTPGRVGWVTTPAGKKEFRRIPYLAGLRNQVMDEMLKPPANQTMFDTILWLGDVVFTVSGSFLEYHKMAIMFSLAFAYVGILYDSNSLN